jgi:glycosyltransferase involved in cell wall biosynthesis
MTIHIVNPLWSANGGSERRAVELAGLLAGQTRTRLWVDSGADTSWLPPGIPLSRLRPGLLRFPRGGTLIFVGCYFLPPIWLRLARPERIVVLVNTPNPEHLIQFMTRLGTLKISTPVELRYAAEWLAEWLGIPGPVDVSPVDLERFKPRATGAGAHTPFVVGRLSRNATYKHHQDDMEVYRCLASEGCHVRIMGAPHWLVQALKGTTGIEMLAPGKESAEDFLASLDCFYYRTDPCWVEPSGRVVFEAMASGLPVVCGPGGYREWMRNGHDSLFVDSTEAALAGLRTLASDRVRAATLGAEARRSMERKFSRQALGDLTRSLREGSPGQPAHVILQVLEANGFT